VKRCRRSAGENRKGDFLFFDEALDFGLGLSVVERDQEEGHVLVLVSGGQLGEHRHFASVTNCLSPGSVSGRTPASSDNRRKLIMSSRLNEQPHSPAHEHSETRLRRRTHREEYKLHGKTQIGGGTRAVPGDWIRTRPSKLVRFRQATGRAAIIQICYEARKATSIRLRRFDPGWFLHWPDCE
jgi:hypothetical protein